MPPGQTLTAPGGSRLIPINAQPRRTPLPEGHATDPTFWDRYYTTHDKETPVDLLETVSYLGRARKFVQVEAAISAYLRHHPSNAEPWMYEALAVAMELNHRTFDQVRTSLGYAAYLARRSKNPEHMTMVADLLFLRGFFDTYEIKVGKQKEQVGVAVLIDAAAEVAPHLPTPGMMSVNLALKTRDPKRMADAIDRLLSLGWPGFDDAMRLQARRAADVLAKALREDGRDEEAEVLLSHLEQSEGRDLFVRLSWTGEADIDLSVLEPFGAVADHFNRRTVFGGALVKSSVGGRAAEEVYVCPRAFDGDYTIRIEPIDNIPVPRPGKDPKKPAADTRDSEPPVREVKLQIITHEGLSSEHKETQTIPIGTKPVTVVVNVTGGRRKTVLPFVAGRPFDPAQLLAKPAASATEARPKPKDATRAAATKPAAPRSTTAQSAAAALGGSTSRGNGVIAPGTPKASRPKPPPIVVPPGSSRRPGTSATTDPNAKGSRP